MSLPPRGPNMLIDLPSEKDRPMFDEFGGAETPPAFWVGSSVEIQDQGASSLTTMGCGSFSNTTGVNAMNIFAGEAQRLRGGEAWEQFIEHFQPLRSRNIRKEGSTLQDILAFGKLKGWISGFYKTRGIPEREKALASGRVIQTGSKQINWRATRKAPYIAEGGGGSAHLFVLNRYQNPAGLISGPNTYSEASYDNGYFHIRYGEADELLYTTYAMIDAKEEETVGRIKLKLALSRIVMKEFNGNPTEEEMDRQAEDNQIGRKYFDYWKRRGDRAY